MVFTIGVHALYLNYSESFKLIGGFKMDKLIDLWRDLAEEHVNGILSFIFWIFALIFFIVFGIAASFFIPFLSIYTASVIIGFEFKWIYVLAVWTGIRLIRQITTKREIKIISED